MKVLALVLLCACTRSAQPTTEPPAPTTKPSAYVPAPDAPSSSPRTARVRDGELLFLELVDQPGPLMDFNAPLPPPGTPRVNHPFLSGSCSGGRPELCSRARTLLLASKSYDEFIAKLRSAGFTVDESKK